MPNWIFLFPIITSMTLCTSPHPLQAPPQQYSHFSSDPYLSVFSAEKQWNQVTLRWPALSALGLPGRFRSSRPHPISRFKLSFTAAAAGALEASLQTKWRKPTLYVYSGSPVPEWQWNWWCGCGGARPFYWSVQPPLFLCLSCPATSHNWLGDLPAKGKVQLRHFADLQSVLSTKNPFDQSFQP